MLSPQEEKELLENNNCPVHLKPCIPRKEDNYFFALSKYQKSLEEVLVKNPDFVQPSFRLNEVQGWIKSGLRDFSISRAFLDWGIPVPNDNKQTIYVWFDALLGYSLFFSYLQTYSSEARHLSLTTILEVRMQHCIMQELIVGGVLDHTFDV
ncbi:hypothetical protein IFM89_008841 [Coptis chinensis]|uniref:Methionyl/Leucyl tRNA synthetase domain-containing protein n=1 Tax=Coptis chinensis TaxID=261450 RepID=A0A835H9Q4_9MAGN|nr:hypothetical protein IFM89_008841 [Coptis chinensis]